MSASVIDLSIGQTARVYSLEGDPAISGRLIDLGIHPGVEIEFIGRMSLGGPFVVRVETSFLALREDEAQCLKVKL